MAGPPLDLHKLIRRDAIVELKASTKEDALRELVDLVRDDPNVTDPDEFLEALDRREHLASTGIGLGIAIPHVKIPEIKDYVVAIGRKKSGIDFNSLDGEPVNLVLLIGASDKQTRDFVKLLAQIVRFLENEKVRHLLLEADIPDDFLDVIEHYSRKDAASP